MEALVILSATLSLFLFQNCSHIQPQQQKSSEGLVLKNNKCPMVSCLEGFQVNLKLAAPVPETVLIKVDQKVLLDECAPNNATQVKLHRPDYDTSSLSIFIGQSIYETPKQFQFELLDQKGCKTPHGKILVNTRFQRDQLHADIDDSHGSNTSCEECPVPPSITWDEIANLEKSSASENRKPASE